jgi:two-component system, cell cycle response regulator DivK
MNEEDSMSNTGDFERELETTEEDYVVTGQADNSISVDTEMLPEINVLHHIQKTILIAEDDEFNFLLIESLLIRNGYGILRAGNGREAVHLHLKYPEICLILMDLQMPVMDGFTATEEIRKTDKLIPVIAQTAFVVKGVKEKAFNSGCDAFLTKPIDPEALIVQINCLLDSRRKKVTE